MSLILSTKNYLAFTDSTIHTAVTPTFRGKQFTYETPGDSAGLFYYLGTLKGTQAWSNPATAGTIVITVKTIAAGTAESLVDRTTNQFYTDNTPLRYIGFDIGANSKMLLQSYLLRNRVESIEYIRNWKMQGSNDVAAPTTIAYDAATWVDLDEQINNDTLIAADSFSHFVCNKGVGDGFRFIRLIQTGLNGAGRDYLCLAEFEFYGIYQD